MKRRHFCFLSFGIGIVFIVYSLGITRLRAVLTSTQPITEEPLQLLDLDHIQISPPTLDPDLWNEILKREEVNLTLLSDLIQNQIRKVQLDCSGVTLKCGHFFDECGFACQVHHRVACLMISYILRIPLIHDEIKGWGYSQKWSDLLLPLGSNCTEGPQTFHWTWYKSSRYEFPFTDGIFVTKPLAVFLNKKLEHPFHWLVGQFMKFAMKLNAQTERDVKRDMEAINFKRPIIGIHVRRTDKIGESATSHHEIQDYMIWAEKGYKKLFNLTTVEGESPTRTAFIASDDAATVVIEAQEKYKNWTVLGFPSQQTLKNPETRKDALYDIVRDVFILSESDYVICGFTSNVCRLLLEMMSFKHPDAYELVKSVDAFYYYDIHFELIQSLKVLGIRGNQTKFLKRNPTPWPKMFKKF